MGYLLFHVNDIYILPANSLAAQAFLFSARMSRAPYLKSRHKNGSSRLNAG
jgi:hypothetical protein